MKIWSKRINFQAILYSPFVLAVLPAIILLYVLPLDFEKYRAEVVKRSLYADKNDITNVNYFDLNGDGNIELVKLGLRGNMDPPLYRIHIYNQNATYEEEWMIKDKVVAFAPVLFEDTDNDQMAEIYFFTKSEDSLFVNKLDPFANPLFGIESVFVDHISADRNIFDIEILSLGFEDHDLDGVLDLTFIAKGGYCRQPRQLYRYNTVNDTIISSEVSGIGFSHINPYTIFDSDYDGKNEFIIGNHRYKNFSEIIYDTKVNFIDTCAWVVGYDDDMKFLFDPIPIRNFLFQPGFLLIDDKPHFYYIERDQADSSFMIIIRDWRAKEVSSFPFPFDVKNIRTMQALSNQSNSRIFISGENDLYHFDLKGNLLEKFSFSVDLVESQAYPFDILGDDQEEILIMNSNGVYFTDYQLKDLAFLPFSEAIYSPFQISVKNKTRNIGVVSINNNAVQYEMKFALDPLYFWRHPIWFAVYLSVVLLLWLTQLLQKKQSQQKYEAERQLMAFRFRALKNQVDPHFTLNALNSIAQMQEQGQQERAGKFLVKFSRMIHRTLENSDKIETTLEEELDFVSDYLDVQQMRFRNSFSFEIKLEDEALSELPVPRHLVHTFVENALKHGLRPLEFPGRLIINVYRERKNVIIEVDDNGIGREEAANSKSLSTGKGLKILDELITLFEKLNKCQISYEIIDKKDEQGKPSGTKVLIKIPDHE